MKIKEVLFGLAVLISLLALFLVLNNQVSAVGETTYCCEKTTEGAWCMDSPPAECATGFRKAPTSCEATSYCIKRGGSKV